jgi:Tfp pilus assembly protein PilV
MLKLWKGTVSRFRSREGISLAEALVMLVIVMTAVMGIVAVSVRVGRMVNSSHMRIAATTAASRQLEQLMVKPYDQVIDGSGYQDGVTMSWTVSDGSAGKAIRLAYRYELPRGMRRDTLTTVRLRP